MCDHNSVERLVMDDIQALDGNIRYTCKDCNETVKKSVHKDKEFNREYKRHYSLCTHDKFDKSEIPTYQNDEGKTCCNWCGTVMN